MIADNTITDAKIISLDYSKLTGVPAGIISSGSTAGGDLTGTYPDPTIAAGAVTGSKIANDTITVANIADEAVENDKLNPNAVGLAIKRTNAGATAVEDAVVKITEMANPASAADVGKIPMVANPYTDGFTLVSPSSVAGPQFLATADILTVANAVGATAWTTYDASSKVPAGAIAVIVQYTQNATTAHHTSDIRKDNTSPTLILGDCGANIGGTFYSGGQGIYPCTTTRRIDYQTSGGVTTIKIIGYIL
jgi:hypothetical protein